LDSGSMKHMKSSRFVALLIAIGLTAGCVDAQVPQVSAPVSTPEAERKAKYAAAKAMFAERCKKSGTFIHRTVEGVDGVYLLKLRPKELNYGDQFRMDDPYGSGVRGQGYIEVFLLGRNAKGSLVETGETIRAYSYVEAVDLEDGKRYRYTGSRKAVSKADINAPAVKWNLQQDPNYDINNYAFVVDKAPAPGTPPRYGVTFDDLSTREEREHWIAGSSLKVIDLQTNEVIAERIGYMMDSGQGAKGGGRSPWLLAADVACPKFPQANGNAFRMYENRDFVEKVLKPKQGD